MTRRLPQESKASLLQKNLPSSRMMMRPERYLELIRTDSVVRLQEKGVDDRLQTLKLGFDQNRPAFDKARQAVKFDENALRADMERLQGIDDPGARQAATTQFLQRWSGTIDALRNATGLTGTERTGGATFAGMQLKGGVLLGDASRVDTSTSQVVYQPLALQSRLSAIRANLKGKQTAGGGGDVGTNKSALQSDPTKGSTPAAGPQQLTLPAPFTSSGTSGSKNKAFANNGFLYAEGKTTFVGSVQSRSFITQSLAVPAGVNRVSVSANFSEFRWSLIVAVILGYGNVESILNLRVMDGSRVVASDRISLKRVSVPAAGWVQESGTETQSLRCEFNRERPGDIVTYTLIAELEIWAGGGGLLGAHTDVSTTGKIASFDVVLYS